VTRITIAKPVEPVLVPLPRDKDGPRTAIVLVDESGCPRAYVNRCKHIPVPLDAGGGKVLSPFGPFLECRTHGARYRLEDGYCFEGPCEGDSLDALEIESGSDASGETVTIAVEP
jgi:nitrite reductase/ring-hydroxylating ferredoxin subunit